MKKLTFIFIFFLIINNIFAQGYSVGLRFKGLTVGSNFNSAYLFSLEGDYGIDKYNLSVGAEITLLVGSVSPFLINHPPSTSISDLAYAVGITGKYYPVSSERLTLVRPFVGIDIGYYFPSNNLYMEGMMIECEDDYKFNSSYDFYTNFNAGLLFFPRGKLSVVLDLTYQFRYPKVKYRKFINCSTVDYSAGRPLIPVEYSQFVNLSMFLWGFGLQFNF